MTCAIGVLTLDGVLLGADTMFSDGIVKIFRSKLIDISPNTSGIKVVAVAAGNDQRSRIAIQAIQESLKRIPPDAMIPAIKEIIDTQVGSTWTEAGSFHLLFAVWTPYEGRAALLSNVGTGTAEEYDYRCIGSGSYIGDYCVPGRSPFVEFSTEEAFVVAVRALRVAKDYIEGCGGDSELRMMLNSTGNVIPVDRNYIQYVEHQIIAFDSLGMRLLMHMGTSDMTAEQFSEHLSREHSQIQEMYRQWRRAKENYHVLPQKRD